MSKITFNSDELFNQKDLLSKLDGKTILIAGACGLIGSSLVEYFLQANTVLNLNIKVIALARSKRKIKARFEHYKKSNLIIIAKDVCSIKEKKFKKYNINYIINLANPAHPLAYAKKPIDVILSSVIGTYNLLKVSQLNNSRFLYISSSEVYGQNVTNDFLSSNKENDYGFIDVLQQRSCYPEGKRIAENLCVSFNSQNNTDALIVRLCQVYGSAFSNDNTRADVQFFKNASSGNDIVMKSLGNQKRSTCYVKDAVTAILYILEFGKTGEAYNVANKNAIVTIRQFAECVAECAKVKIINSFATSEESKGYTKISHAVICADKLESLGWTPSYSLKDGINDTLRQIEEN